MRATTYRCIAFTFTFVAFLLFGITKVRSAIEDLLVRLPGRPAGRPGGRSRGTRVMVGTRDVQLTTD